MTDSAPREWFEICDTNNRKVDGLIPRDVVEAMGIDCSTVGRGGTIWFTKAQSETIHAHPEWEAAEGRGTP